MGQIPRSIERISSFILNPYICLIMYVLFLHYFLLCFTLFSHCTLLYLEFLIVQLENIIGNVIIFNFYHFQFFS